MCKHGEMASGGEMKDFLALTRPQRALEACGWDPNTDTTK